MTTTTSSTGALVPQDRFSSSTTSTFIGTALLFRHAHPSNKLTATDTSCTTFTGQGGLPCCATGRATGSAWPFGYDTQRSRPPSGLLLEFVRPPQLGPGKCPSILQLCRGRPLVSTLQLYPRLPGLTVTTPRFTDVTRPRFHPGVVLWPTFLVVGHNN